MLAPLKVKELLMHEDPEVRDEAVFYLEKHFDRTLATADDLWASIDRYGANQTDRIIRALPFFHQTHASVCRLVEFLKDDRQFEKYIELVPSLGVGCIKANHDLFLNNAKLYARLNQTVQFIRDLYSIRPDLLWKELRQCALELPSEWDPDAFDECMTMARVIVDRGGEMWKEAVDILTQERKDSWEELFAIHVAGGLKRTEVIPALLPRLDLYDDFQAEAIPNALVAMADPVVVRAIAEFHGNVNEDFRFCAAEVLARYPVPESQQLLLSWAKNPSGSEPGRLVADLCYFVRRQLPDEPEVIDFLKANIEQSHVYFAPMEYGEDGLVLLGKMTGVQFPEVAQWEHDRNSRRTRRVQQMMNSRADWEESYPNEFDEHPITHGPKVGRNEPCPCGSGKKHKKCCLGKGPVK
jgi:hypothetical protein